MCIRDSLTILLLGNGGRESAIAWKLMQSPRLKKLYVAPGNGSPLGEPVALNILDFEAMADFCSTHAVDMIMVGPELPLVQGIADLVLVYPDHLELLDYKTDRRKTRADLVRAYRAQLELYAKAIDKRFAPRRVTYKGIYSLELGELIEV